MASPFPIPLNALRAIEIVARRGALEPAAEELGVTIGAVSQHLRRAEERLGIELFERTPQGLGPTAALRQIAPQLSAGFTTLQDALGGLKNASEHVLTLTVGSVFASRWLIWRIGKFTALHPEHRAAAGGDRPDASTCAIRHRLRHPLRARAMAGRAVGAGRRLALPAGVRARAGASGSGRRRTWRMCR